MAFHDVKHHRADQDGDHNQNRPGNKANPLLINFLLLHDSLGRIGEEELVTNAKRLRRLFLRYAPDRFRVQPYHRNYL